MADPRRMTPEEHGESHALLVKAVTDPDWQAAGQALDDLMGKLVVLHRLLEAADVGADLIQSGRIRAAPLDGEVALLDHVLGEGDHGDPLTRGSWRSGR